MGVVYILSCYLPGVSFRGVLSCHLILFWFGTHYSCCCGRCWNNYWNSESRQSAVILSFGFLFRPDSHSVLFAFWASRDFTGHASCQFRVNIIRGAWRYPDDSEIILVRWWFALANGRQLLCRRCRRCCFSIKHAVVLYVSEIFRAGIQSVDKRLDRCGRSQALWWMHLCAMSSCPRLSIMPSAAK